MTFAQAKGKTLGKLEEMLNLLVRERYWAARSLGGGKCAFCMDHRHNFCHGCPVRVECRTPHMDQPSPYTRLIEFICKDDPTSIPLLLALIMWLHTLKIGDVR